MGHPSGHMQTRGGGQSDYLSPVHRDSPLGPLHPLFQLPYPGCSHGKCSASPGSSPRQPCHTRALAERSFSQLCLHCLPLGLSCPKNKDWLYGVPSKMTIKLSWPLAASLQHSRPVSQAAYKKPQAQVAQEYDYNSSVSHWLFLYVFFSKGRWQDVVMYACNPNARETEAGGMPKLQSQSFYSN